jgi:hypothetical protein
MRTAISETTTDYTRDELDAIDRDALDLAIELTLDRDPEFAPTVRAHLKDGDYWLAGTFAAYCRQLDHLQLDTDWPPMLHRA